MRFAYLILAVAVLSCQNRKTAKVPYTFYKKAGIYLTEEQNNLQADYFSERSDSFGGWDQSWFYGVNDSIYILNHSGTYSGAYPSPMHHVTIHRHGQSTALKADILPVYASYPISKTAILLLGKGEVRPSGPAWYDQVKEAYILCIKDSMYLAEESIRVELPGVVELSEKLQRTDDTLVLRYEPDNNRLISKGYDYDMEQYWDTDSVDVSKTYGLHQIVNDKFEQISSVTQEIH